LNSRNLFASILMACLLAIGFLDMASPDAASAGQFVLKPEGTRNYVLVGKRRARGTRIHLPMGPSYIYYDYPYYYCRGYYPTHIGGYVYYPPRRNSYARYNGRCFNWHRKGVARKSAGACRCL
jgi:hypothetical protein